MGNRLSRRDDPYNGLEPYAPLPLFPGPKSDRGGAGLLGFVPVVHLELVEVELTSEPVVAFFHIRVRHAEGFAWTVLKRYAELVGFFDTMRPVTGLPSLPWNLDEVSLAKSEEAHGLVQRQLDGLLGCQDAIRQQIFMDFFQVSEEYQQRVSKVNSLESRGPMLVKRAERLVEELHRQLQEQHSKGRRLSHPGNQAQPEQPKVERKRVGRLTSKVARLCEGAGGGGCIKGRRQSLERNMDREASLVPYWDPSVCPERFGGTEQCERVRLASLRHLLRHPEWLSGVSRPSENQLRRLLAMQHYIDRDLQDFQQPEANRCFKDAFEGGCVSRQLLLDATRSDYLVDGRTFNYSELCEEHGRPDDQEGLLKHCFLESLVAAIQDSLGRGVAPPPLLARVITSTMSQAGLASLDMACGGPHLAISGGDHQVNFSLEARADGAWDVTIASTKQGFDRFVVLTPGDVLQVDSRSHPCSTRSSIAMECTIRFTVQVSCGEVIADVIRLQKDVIVVDQWGRSLLREACLPTTCWSVFKDSAGCPALKVCGR